MPLAVVERRSEGNRELGEAAQRGLEWRWTGPGGVAGLAGGSGARVGGWSGPVTPKLAGGRCVCKGGERTARCARAKAMSAVILACDVIRSGETTRLAGRRDTNAAGGTGAGRASVVGLMFGCGVKERKKRVERRRLFPSYLFCFAQQKPRRRLKVHLLRTVPRTDNPRPSLPAPCLLLNLARNPP